jgi:hypothetical protein
MEMSDLTRGEMDAKIDVASARAQTDLARLEGKLETLTATLVGKLDTVTEKISADHVTGVDPESETLGFR